MFGAATLPHSCLWEPDNPHLNPPPPSRSYGFLGQNGSGKTNFLQCLANREVPIPAHVDLYHLREEARLASPSRSASSASSDRRTLSVALVTAHQLSGGCAQRAALCVTLPPRWRRPTPSRLTRDLPAASTQAEKSDRTALQAVIDHIKNEMDRLNALEEQIMTESGPEDERLEAIYARLEELDPTTFEARCAAAEFGCALVAWRGCVPGRALMGVWG